MGYIAKWLHGYIGKSIHRLSADQQTHLTIPPIQPCNDLTI